MKKHSSLLDYSYPGLSPDIWQAEGTLLPYHKDYILKLITSFYETYKFKDPTAWVKDITNVGSLTTNKYLRTSDFDCHIIVDLKQFQKTNMPDVSIEEAALYLDNARKEWDRAKILLPFGEHPLELYFESELSPSNTKAVGRYSLVSNSWLKEPVFFAQDDDYEQSKHKIIEEAIQMANDLDASFGNIRRDIQRIDELKQVAQAWPADTRNFYMEKIQGKLDAIEEEIEKAVAMQQALIDERHQKQDPFSENEIKFKYLARFFYFYVISELKDLMKKTDGEVTETELPAIKKIVTEAAKDPQATETDICIDFDHTIAEGAKYPAIGEPIKGAKESLAKLKEMGYNIIIYTCRGDSKEGAELVREWLDKHEMSYDSIFQGEKPFAKYYIDDRAIRFDSWDNVLTQVGKSNKKASASVLNVEPYEGGVEFRVLVNPTRSQVARSLQQAKYQELRVIQGNNTYIWDAGQATHEHVLMYLVDQGLEEYSGVQTGYVLNPTDIDEFTWKSGSLLISAAQWPEAFYLSPTGKLYPVARTHDEWLVMNTDLLKKEYNLDFRKAYGKSFDASVGDIMDALLSYGWTRGSVAANHKDYIAQVNSIQQVPNTAIDFFLGGPDNMRLTIEDAAEANFVTVTKDDLLAGQKGINKAFRRQINGSMKVAAYNHAYWIDPNGKIFEVRGAEGNDSSPSSTHHKWVNKNVDMLRNEYGIVPTKSEYGENLGTKELLDKGWVRIGDGYNADWGITVQDINNIPTTVDNALAQFAPEGSEITIEDNKWENAVLFQWPVNSVQKAVQQALRRRKENPAFQPALAASQLPLSKREIKALNPYGDDSLKQGPAYAIFEHIQKGLPEFNVPDIKMYTILGDSPLFGSTVAETKLQELGIPIGQQKQAQTKKVKQGEYGAVMALIPHDVAQDVVAWGVRNIPDDKVYSNPDNPRLGRELESHITIKYGLQTEDAKSVRRFFNESKPFKAKLGKVRHFQPPEMDFDVVTVEIISEDLDRMNAEVTKEFDCAEGLASDVYHPHITVSYVKRDTGKDYVGSTEFEGIEVELDTIIFSPAKGNRTYFSISHDKEGAFHIEKIRKNAYSSGNWAESAWISPSGEVFDLEGDSHEDAIYDLINDSKIYDQEDPLSYAINKGWTRFGEMGGGGETGANVKSLKNINPAVFTHATKYTGQDKQMVVADNSGTFVYMPVDEFVLGQGAVNKAIQQKRMQGSLKKKAGYDIGYWVDPSGNVYDCHAEGLVHNEWILGNLEMLQDKYGLEIPNYLMRESLDYFKAMETGEEDNFDQPSSDEVWDQMLKTGWARVGDADDGLGLEVLDIRNVPAHMDSLIGQDLHDRDVLRVDDIKHNSVAIQYPFKNIQQAVNKALQQKRMGKQATKVEDVDGVRVYINPSQEELIKLSKSFHQEFMNLPSVRALIDNTTGDIYAWDGWFQEHTTMKKNLGLENASHWDGGSDDLSHLYALQEDMRHSTTNKQADFLPSFVQAPDNDWQFAGGGDDKEIPVDPDGQSDEQTNMAPCTTGKPRKDQMWRELWHMIKSPFSKKDKEAAADTEQEQIEKNELGEDETLLEYSKHFKDLNRFNTNKPKTTWDAGPSKAPNQQEPYSPLPVTLDVVTNPANENWRYPWRFTRRPIGDQSNQGDVTQALEHMLQNLASLQKKAYGQSNSVPDYLMDEWKTEQIHDDVDSEPYVNHDQRDYPYGMHDSPENTDSNIGWAKDNEPYVVRLDQIEKPFNRKWAPGLPEYQVFFFDTMPMSDGSEI